MLAFGDKVHDFLGCKLVGHVSGDGSEVGGVGEVAEVGVRGGEGGGHEVAIAIIVAVLKGRTAGG